jgi:hypothetical protein
MSINETSNTMQTSNDCPTIPTKVVIELFDGCVSKVTTDSPLEVVVLDRNIGEGADVIKVDGEDVAFHRFDAEVDDDVCQAVFKEIDDYENQPD